MARDLEYFGCDEIGFDLSSLGPAFQAAGGMASGAISDYELEEKKKAASAAERKAADVAIAADVTAALAVARALSSAKNKAPSAQIDKVAADNAVTAEDRAAAGLSSTASDLRAAATDLALADAIKKAQASPKDVYAQSLVEAWTAISNKAHAGNIVTQGAAQDGKRRDDGGGSWLTEKSVGGLPRYGVLGIGAALVTGVGVAVKRFFF